MMELLIASILTVLLVMYLIIREFYEVNNLTKYQPRHYACGYPVIPHGVVGGSTWKWPPCVLGSTHRGCHVDSCGNDDAIRLPSISANEVRAHYGYSSIDHKKLVDAICKTNNALIAMKMDI